MIKNRSKGFTLIELLVVIAIIGILSAVVLASLNTARSKGSDAAIQSNLESIRTQAELEYSNYNQYLAANPNGTCPTTVQASSMFDSTVVNALSQTTAAGSAVKCYGATGSTGAYKISASLISQSGKFFCIDSTGFGGVVATQSTANTCP